MGTLYIDRKDLHIKLDGNAIAFYANGKRDGIVPVNPLKRVVIAGNVTVETPVLHKLASENISIIFLSGKRFQFRGMLHGRLHNNGLLRLKQYEKANSGFCMDIAYDLVTRKINGQIRLLLDVRDQRADLRFQLTNAVNILSGVLDTLRLEDGDMDTVRGLEGGASASYFSAYTKIFPESLEFRRRNRRPPEDPVNAMLSLCYTLLHYEMVREIEVLGLDPTIGFYHQFDYGRESLACDLVEPYRPEVDRFVWSIFRERKFALRDFAVDDEKPGCYLKKAARGRFYPIYEEWAKIMRPVWVDEVRTLARRIIDGEDALSV